MSRNITISQSVDPNTFVFEIHEEHRTRMSALLSRAEIESLCDKIRALLNDPVIDIIPGPKMSIFPNPQDQPMKVIIKS